MAEVETVGTKFSNSSKNFRNITENHVTVSSPFIGPSEIDLVTRRDEDGDTFLHIAVSKNNFEACRRLMAVMKSAELSLDVKNNMLQTPLHIACVIDSPQLVALLLNVSPSGCNVTDRHGNNCVHLAVKYSSSKTKYNSLKAVLEFASTKSLEKKNLYGYTPMHLGAIHGKPETIHLLKKAGANINTLDNRGGATPLILATKASQREAAQALLELGGNPSLRTTYGETASQLASAKGDHVISELLALYDSSGDSIKPSTLSRFMNDSGSVANRNQIKQVTTYSRNPDVKMKSLVNSGVVHLPPPLAVPPQRSLFCPPSPHIVPFVVKSERFSPVNPFSNNFKQSVAPINRKDEDTPLNYSLVRRQDERRINPPIQQKRKSDADDAPLDLSVKKLKPSPDVYDSSLSASDNTRRSSKQTSVVHPVQTQTASLLVNSMPLHQTMNSQANLFAPAAVAHRKHSTDPHPMRALHPSFSLLAAGSSGSYQAFERQMSEVQQLLVYQNSRTKMSSHEEHSNIMESNSKPMKHYNDKPDTVSRNGVFYPVQMIDSAHLGYQRLFVSRAGIPLAGDTPPHLVRRLSNEARNHIQSVKTKPSESRDQNLSTQDRLLKGNYSNKSHQTLDKISSYSSSSSYSPDYHSKSPAKEVTISDDSSTNRDRRFQSDNSFTKSRRSTEKNFASRRNSAPVSVKGNNEKLDLRSYTGCLPPHYLHLLESSGNLPVRASNVLRSISDVLQDNHLPQDSHIEVKKSVDKSKHHNRTHIPSTSTPPTPSVVPVYSSAHLLPPAPKTAQVSSSSSVPPSSTPSYSANFKEKHFASLGDWSGIESGEYPAFGKPLQIPSDKIKPSPPQVIVSEPLFVPDETLFSESTRKILKNAVRVSTNGSNEVLRLSGNSSINKRHSCGGCSAPQKRIPPLIADIWRYQPTLKYVTSYTASPSVVFSCQIPSSKSFSSNENEKTNDSKNQSTSNTNTSHTLLTSSKQNVLSASAIKDASTRLDSSNAKTRETSNPGSIPNQAILKKKNMNGVEKLVESALSSTMANERSIRSHVPYNGVSSTTSSLAFIAENGFHEKIWTEAIRKSFMKNLESYSEIQKLKSVQSSLINDGKDSYRDLHISDLEISDDETELIGRKKSN